MTPSTNITKKGQVGIVNMAEPFRNQGFTIDNYMRQEAREYNGIEKLNKVNFPQWNDFQNHNLWIAKMDQLIRENNLPRGNEPDIDVNRLVPGQPQYTPFTVATDLPVGGNVAANAQNPIRDGVWLRRSLIRTDGGNEALITHGFLFGECQAANGDVRIWPNEIAAAPLMTPTASRNRSRDSQIRAMKQRINRSKSRSRSREKSNYEARINQIEQVGPVTFIGQIVDRNTQQVYVQQACLHLD